MRITVSHNKGQKEAMRIVDDTIDKMLQPDAAGPVKINNTRKNWNGPNMDFGLHARVGPVGVPINGKVYVTDTEVTIDAELPWLMTRLIPERQVQASVENRVRGLLNGNNGSH